MILTSVDELISDQERTEPWSTSSSRSSSSSASSRWSRSGAAAR